MDKMLFVDGKIDFNIMLPDGEDITDRVLENPSYTFLMFSAHLENASEENVERINEIYDYSREHGYDFYCITASSPEKTEEWEANTGAEYPFLKADETLLKTVIRSNPGLLLVKQGKVLYKWSSAQIPDELFFDKPLDEIAFDKKAQKSKRIRLAVAFALLIVPLGIVAARKKAYEKQGQSDAPEKGAQPENKNSKTE